LQSDARPFRVLSVLTEETVPIQGGSMHWVPLRRRLGISAFGTNVYRASRKGDPVIEDHVESPGQEELYLVIAGGAKFVVGGEEIDAPVGTAIFVQDPEARRRGDAVEDGTVVLAVGGWPGQPYHSLPWEPIYLAQEPMRREDWAAAADVLEREGKEHAGTAILQYRLACCHARLGEHDLALEELRRAIAVNPDMRDRAAEEEHLASLRDLPGWAAAIA
jgi:tetratricopeptide (TPR) repeat protein